MASVGEGTVGKLSHPVSQRGQVEELRLLLQCNFVRPGIARVSSQRCGLVLIVQKLLTDSRIVNANVGTESKYAAPANKYFIGHSEIMTCGTLLRLGV